MSETNNNTSQNSDHTDSIITEINDDTTGNRPGKTVSLENPDEYDKISSDQFNNQKIINWALWRLFVIPERIRHAREELDQKQSEDGKVEEELSFDHDAQESEQDFFQIDSLAQKLSNANLDADQYIPMEDNAVASGVMKYIIGENGLVSFEELMAIDAVLSVNKNTGPKTPGIDSYDDWGVERGFQMLSTFSSNYYTMSFSERSDMLDELERVFGGFPEIITRVQRIKSLLHVPVGRIQKSNNQNPSDQNPFSFEYYMKTPEGRVFLDTNQSILLLSMSEIHSFSPRVRAIETLGLTEYGTHIFNGQTKEFALKLAKKHPMMAKNNAYLLRYLLESVSGNPVEFSARTSDEYSTPNMGIMPLYYPVWFRNRNDTENKTDKHDVSMTNKKSGPDDKTWREFVNVCSFREIITSVIQAFFIVSVLFAVLALMIKFLLFMKLV